MTGWTVLKSKQGSYLGYILTSSLYPTLGRIVGSHFDDLFKEDRDLQRNQGSQYYGRELISLDKTALVQPVMAQHVEAY